MHKHIFVHEWPSQRANWEYLAGKKNKLVLSIKSLSLSYFAKENWRGEKKQIFAIHKFLINTTYCRFTRQTDLFIPRNKAGDRHTHGLNSIRDSSRW